MADDIMLEVVTPDRRVVKQHVRDVSVPGAVGEFGVLPGHKPFMTILGTGILTYRTTDGSHSLVVSQGFAEVADNCVTVMAEAADELSEIDVEKARADIRVLEEKLKGKGLMDEEFPLLRAQLERAVAKVNLSGKR